MDRLNHVAIAVPDLIQAIGFYRDILCAKVSMPQPLPNHGITTAFVELENVKIELLHPLGENSLIKRFLEKRPAGGLHHICIGVDQLDRTMKTIKEQSIRMLGTEPTIGAHGKPIIFLDPRDSHGVLIEFEQR